MDRAFLLPGKPFHNTCLVELAKAFQPRQLIANIILDKADRTFLSFAVLANTVLLGGCKG